MKISWNWLTQLIDLKGINQSELVEHLTLAGFEIENIIHNKNIQDIILDINISANRLDIISLASIVVEITAILNIPSTMHTNINQYHKEIKYKALNYFDDLNKYTKLNLSITKNLSIKNSPKWIQNYLIASDINPTNSILDIINLINFKWGQSIEIFYINKDKNDKIKKLTMKCQTERSTQKQLYNTNWKEIKTSARKLNSKNINDYQNTEISLLIIGSILQNISINNKQSKESKKSKQYLMSGYVEAINLIKQIYKTNIEDNTIYDYENTKIKAETIQCNINNINKILGPIKSKSQIKYLDKKTIINILEKLNFLVIDNINELKIKIPEERLLDIEKEIDIVEEIGRIYGFNYFNDHLPIPEKIGKISSEKLVTQKIRQILRSMGLHEVLNYSLESSFHNNNLKLINPLNKDQKKLRTNLIAGLIESTVHNNKQANEAFEVFEIGKIFTNTCESKKVNENLHLAGVLGNNCFCRSTWNQAANELSWFQAKGNIEELFERMHIKVSWSANSENNYLIDNLKQYIHPQRTSYIRKNNYNIGLFSQVNSKIAKKVGAFYKIYVFEININQLIAAVQQRKHLAYLYKPYSNYPKITRDISIKVNKYITTENIINIISKIQREDNDFVESINIFDEYYETKTIKRIGLRTTYRAKNKTLTNEEIERIEKIFKNKLNIEIMKSKS
uniref:phenylalanyl-tRNA synthetase beta chain n=1 Tax=Phymatolithon calcareum TaxID=1277942 RepID=UPI0023F0A458|nr:phenylalanyl-tRNA synthetase beta chain [Phymatolithon calcareum]WEA76902.1 phenylalanyl-tRNA synthetase beta chain [Phymatolithon calcareum]